MRKYIAPVLRLLVIAVVILILFAQVLRRTGMFFPERYPLGSWDGVGLLPKPEDVWFTATDGVRLHAWLFRAPDPHAPLLIWCHGNAGNLTGRAPYGASFARRGISALLFDYRGYGRSGGRASESGLYLDVLAAYDFAVKQLGAKPQSIVMYGESLGGPYAAFAAKERGARCVVIESSFGSLKDLGNALYFPLPIGWLAPFAQRTRVWLNEARVPVLVMHGRRDQVIPFAIGMKLYEGLTAPKQLFVSETAGHCEIPAIEGDRYYETVCRFVAGIEN
ncbi:MAG TPA: alpha/beta hydrolase [Thermoanaerobaculia bacterium]|nr:alpha/beta hydrolase [Thermoanaerobaculia bacterium]